MDPYCCRHLHRPVPLGRRGRARGARALVQLRAGVERAGALSRPCDVGVSVVSSEVGDDGREIRFACNTWHASAARRLFLEAAKQDPSAPLLPRPLEVPDTRSEQTIRIEPLGNGAYRVRAEGVTEDTPSRAPAIAAALVKLAQLAGSDDQVVTFPCGHEHDALVALMLLRAQNLRAALREEELNASRGVLVAPSAQE